MSKKSKILICSLIAIVLAVGGGVFFLQSKPKDDNGLKIDKNVITGSVDSKTLDERLAEAQKQVDEGMLAIDIAPNPVFQDGKSEGKIMVGNPARNTKNFTVEFVLEESNESIYKSGLIPPNGYIEKAVLDKNLEKGEYPTIAYFTSYDSDGVECGKVGLNILITILN